MPRRDSVPVLIPHGDNSLSSWLITAQTLVLLMVSSWAFGGMMPWSPYLLAGLILLLIPALIARYQEKGRIDAGAFIPAGLWIFFVGISTLNPSHVIGELGWQPRPGWIDWLPATPSIELTKTAAIPWLLALLQGGILIACPPGRRQTRLIWRVAALNGFVLAVVGAAFHFMDSPLMLGFIEAPQSYFFATFFYKNHWAAYGALCGGAGLTLAIDACPDALKGSPQAFGRALLFGGTSLITLITLPLPGSRSGVLMGIALLAGAMGVFLWLVYRQIARKRRVRWPVVAIPAGLILGIISYGAIAYSKTGAGDFARTESQIQNAKHIEDMELRFVLSRDTWHMAQKRLWFGWGVGSYEIVFPVFQGDYLRDADGRPTARFKAAHNDWLQQLAETGVIGTMIFVIPLVRLGIKNWRLGGLASRWSIGVGSLLLCYALVDFPFHNPAVLLLWTVLWTTAGRIGDVGSRSIKQSSRP